MELVTEIPAAAFDLTQIRRGCLLWGKHVTWKEGKAGFVTAATRDTLIVQYFPGIGNVTNHFIIPVEEAAAGQWEIRWSADLKAVQEYGIPESVEPDQKPAEPDQEPDTEAGKGDDSDTGGTDL